LGRRGVAVPVRAHHGDERTGTGSEGHRATHRSCGRDAGTPAPGGVTRQPALLRREGTTLDGRPYLIRPTQPGEAAAIVALQDAVAAEDEYIAALPRDPEAMDHETALSRHP